MHQTIVEAQTAADVQAAVQFANEHGLPLTVQTTGHGQPQCASGGVLILLGKLKTVTIDREAGAYLPYLFGPAGFCVIRKPEELPRRLPLLYVQLTSV